MIGKLKGCVDSIDSESVLLDVSGVGYLVYCSSKTLQILLPGASHSLYIETYVREDSIKLFGFLTLAEKELFLLLQSVNGVGAKMALGILSSLDLDQLRQAILDRDKSVLLSVSGIGPKIAERIIVELKNNKNLVTANFATATSFVSSKVNDAVMGLVFLGFTKSEAVACVEKVLATDSQMQIDDIIKQSLILRNKV